MKSKDKKQCPVRLYPDVYDKLRDKLESDGLSYQQFAELLFNAYLRNNKGIVRLVRRYVESKNPEKSGNQLDPDERDDLLRLIEENSPLRYSTR